jgi:hypothetical protein
MTISMQAPDYLAPDTDRYHWLRRPAEISA